ncbi:hypothetical protein HPB48_016863 [Haemaphysalis longicornis]|uniref:Uncharacterized protein n=1 Tax=Haemaphysalis longicornis TaxID=44386 RepID=A0A9J6GYI9_HAELO|nr:hypothetical protein HPB48_016863 [Haemaphysalis longicornis]
MKRVILVSLFVFGCRTLTGFSVMLVSFLASAFRARKLSLLGVNSDGGDFGFLMKPFLSTRTRLAHSEEINEKIKEGLAQKTAVEADALQLRAGIQLELCTFACLPRGDERAEKAPAISRLYTPGPFDSFDLKGSRRSLIESEVAATPGTGANGGWQEGFSCVPSETSIGTEATIVSEKGTAASLGSQVIQAGFDLVTEVGGAEPGAEFLEQAGPLSETESLEVDQSTRKKEQDRAVVQEKVGADKKGMRSPTKQSRTDFSEKEHEFYRELSEKGEKDCVRRRRAGVSERSHSKKSELLVPSRKILRFRRLGQTASLLITIEGPSLPRHAVLCSTVFRLYPPRPNSQQCLHCFRLEHRTLVCPNLNVFLRCATCGTKFPPDQSPSDTRHDCEPRCVNCSGEHPATDPNCPARDEATKVLRERTRTLRRRYMKNPRATSIDFFSQRLACFSPRLIGLNF